MTYEEAINAQDPMIHATMLRLIAEGVEQLEGEV